MTCCDSAGDVAVGRMLIAILVLATVGVAAAEGSMEIRGRCGSTDGLLIRACTQHFIVHLNVSLGLKQLRHVALSALEQNGMPQMCTLVANETSSECTRAWFDCGCCVAWDEASLRVDEENERVLHRVMRAVPSLSAKRQPPLPRHASAARLYLDFFQVSVRCRPSGPLVAASSGVYPSTLRKLQQTLRGLHLVVGEPRHGAPRVAVIQRVALDGEESCKPSELLEDDQPPCTLVRSGAEGRFGMKSVQHQELKAPKKSPLPRASRGTMPVQWGMSRPKPSVAARSHSQRSSLSFLSPASVPRSARHAGREDIIPREYYFGAGNHSAHLMGRGVSVAFLDSGLDVLHPALSHRRLLTAEEHDEWHGRGQRPRPASAAPALLCLSMVPGVRCDDDYADGHGTFSAGIVAAKQQDADTAGGYTGLAPEADVVMLRVFGTRRYSRASFFLRALAYCAALGVDVINLSLGGGHYLDEKFVARVRELSHGGTVIVAASGNDGPLFGSVSNPADMNDAIAVGSLRIGSAGIAGQQSFWTAGPPSHQRAGLWVSSFSSRGPTTWEFPFGMGRVKPDVVAPGERIRSLRAHRVGGRWSSSLRTTSGTSAATPIVAGIAALLIQHIHLNPLPLLDVNIATVKLLLHNSSLILQPPPLKTHSNRTTSARRSDTGHNASSPLQRLRRLFDSSVRSADVLDGHRRRLQQYSIHAQGAGEVCLACALHVIAAWSRGAAAQQSLFAYPSTLPLASVHHLHRVAKWTTAKDSVEVGTSTLPHAPGILLECLYFWPYCEQPLFPLPESQGHVAPVLVVNVSLFNTGCHSAHLTRLVVRITNATGYATPRCRRQSRAHECPPGGLPNVLDLSRVAERLLVGEVSPAIGRTPERSAKPLAFESWSSSIGVLFSSPSSALEITLCSTSQTKADGALGGGGTWNACDAQLTPDHPLLELYTAVVDGFVEVTSTCPGTSASLAIPFSVTVAVPPPPSHRLLFESRQQWLFPPDYIPSNAIPENTARRWESKVRRERQDAEKSGPHAAVGLDFLKRFGDHPYTNYDALFLHVTRGLGMYLFIPLGLLPPLVDLSSGARGDLEVARADEVGSSGSRHTGEVTTVAGLGRIGTSPRARGESLRWDDATLAAEYRAARTVLFVAPQLPLLREQRRVLHELVVMEQVLNVVFVTDWHSPLLAEALEFVDPGRSVCATDAEEVSASVVTTGVAAEDVCGMGQLWAPPMGVGGPTHVPSVSAFLRQSLGVSLVSDCVVRPEATPCDLTCAPRRSDGGMALMWRFNLTAQNETTAPPHHVLTGGFTSYAGCLDGDSLPIPRQGGRGCGQWPGHQVSLCSPAGAFERLRLWREGGTRMAAAPVYGIWEDLPKSPPIVALIKVVPQVATDETPPRISNDAGGRVAVLTSGSCLDSASTRSSELSWNRPERSSHGADTGSGTTRDRCPHPSSESAKELINQLQHTPAPPLCTSLLIDLLGHVQGVQQSDLAIADSCVDLPHDQQPPPEEARACNERGSAVEAEAEVALEEELFRALVRRLFKAAPTRVAVGLQVSESLRLLRRRQQEQQGVASVVPYQSLPVHSSSPTVAAWRREKLPQHCPPEHCGNDESSPVKMPLLLRSKCGPCDIDDSSSRRAGPQLGATLSSTRRKPLVLASGEGPFSDALQRMSAAWLASMQLRVAAELAVFVGCGIVVRWMLGA